MGARARERERERERELCNLSSWKFSKVSFLVNLPYDLTIALSVENFCQSTRLRAVSNARRIAGIGTPVVE